MGASQPLKTEAYVRIDGRLVNTVDLSTEQKERLADWLKTTYLNNLYAGQAVFRRVLEDGDLHTLQHLDQPDAGTHKEADAPPR